MSTANTLFEAVREAWASVSPPPPEDMTQISWGWGDEAARAFVGVAPIDVDILSAGFYAATPLFDLPARAAAAYLGTYLLSVLRSLEEEESTGFYFEVVTRAHTTTCLKTPWFWERVIRPFLSMKCREVLADVVAYFASHHDMLALTKDEARAMEALATSGLTRNA